MTTLHKPLRPRSATVPAQRTATGRLVSTYPSLESVPRLTVPPIGRRKFRAGRFWIGALLTAAVVAMVGMIGLAAATRVLRLPIPLAQLGLPTGVVGVAGYGLIAVLLTLLAAAGFHTLHASAVRTLIPFGAVGGLLVAAAVALPFITSMSVVAQLAVAATNLVIGAGILLLVPLAAVKAGARA